MNTRDRALKLLEQKAASIRHDFGSNRGLALRILEWLERDGLAVIHKQVIDQDYVEADIRLRSALMNEVTQPGDPLSVLQAAKQLVHAYNEAHVALNMEVGLPPNRGLCQPLDIGEWEYVLEAELRIWRRTPREGYTIDVYVVEERDMVRIEYRRAWGIYDESGQILGEACTSFYSGARAANLAWDRWAKEHLDGQG